MGLQFFPRGGSAQVARYLLAALRESGCTASLATGSLGEPGDDTHAGTFFAGLGTSALDYTGATHAFAAGIDPLTTPVPMHPSYEDRTDVPDRLLAAVDPALGEHLASVWEDRFTDAQIDRADLVHLHHLTAQHETVTRRWPHLPRVVHLHGTELKFLEAVDERVGVAEALGRSLATMARAEACCHLDTAALDNRQREVLETTRWEQWRHGEHWRSRLVAMAQAADHLVTVSSPDRATAMTLLGVEPERVTAITNAVDIERFSPQSMTADERRAWFRKWLVDDPQGWTSDGAPGTVRYDDRDVDRLVGTDGSATVLIYVGRFTEAKRVPLLVRAFAKARAGASGPLSLVVWGGHPGEWEGEHPVDVARQMGEDGIFFAGWRGHDDLPAGLAACDALVMPSVNDSFAQTALEAMAVGLPVIATLSGGFPSMINLEPGRPTGWLVAPDDPDALAQIMTSVADHPAELLRRGRFALAHAQADLSWTGQVPAFEAVYDTAIEHRRTHPNL